MRSFKVKILGLLYRHALLNNIEHNMDKTLALLDDINAKLRGKLKDKICENCNFWLPYGPRDNYGECCSAEDERGGEYYILHKRDGEGSIKVNKFNWADGLRGPHLQVASPKTYSCDDFEECLTERLTEAASDG